MKALVTGATGLVGSNLVRALLAGGHKVSVLVRRESDRRALSGLDVEYCVGNILAPLTLRQSMDDCDVMFHAAAVFAFTGMTQKKLNEVAVAGTRNVLRAAATAGVQRVVLTSSSVVFGSTTKQSVRNEQSPIEDSKTTDYANSKISQHRTAFEMCRSLGLNLVAVCPTLTVGAHDYRLNPSNAAITNYLNNPIRVTYPGGCNVVSVRDVARGHVLIAERGKPGEAYLLGGTNMTWQQVHETISEICKVDGPSMTVSNTTAYLTAAVVEAHARLTGRQPATTLAEARMAGRYYWYDHSKAASLGYTPTAGRQAIREALSWLLKTTHVNRFDRNRIKLVDESNSMAPAHVEVVH